MSETVNKDEKRPKVEFESSDLERVGVKDDKNGSTPEGMPLRFFEYFILQDLNVDLIDHGRLVCSIKVPPRLLNAGNFLHGGAIATLVDMVGSTAVFTVGIFVKRVSVEINVSYFGAASAGVLQISYKPVTFTQSVSTMCDEDGLSKTYKATVACNDGFYEEIEIEAKVLGFGKAVAVSSVEFRKKITGEVIAQGRHTMFLSLPSKL